MMDAVETKRVIKSLEKAPDSKTILELLNNLRDNVKATESFLRETKVGVAVNNFKGHSDPEVKTLVKKIIRQWKEQVSLDKKKRKQQQHGKIHHYNSTNGDSHSHSRNGSTSGASSAQATHSSSVSSPTTTTKSASLEGDFITTKTRTPANDGIKISVHDNTTRNGSISGLYTALAIESKLQPPITTETR
ncbi:unnamed protein product [Ambrosiozyma monospora]|uniref:Unnamed protein product n=1 Tax=Ambrosiozyma monospora TaxID=43982 RepID=A0ACB5TS97_AMBMO|nr:unnamed protein product [Ambrosiozyma monospora]